MSGGTKQLKATVESFELTDNIVHPKLRERYPPWTFLNPSVDHIKVSIEKRLARIAAYAVFFSLMKGGERWQKMVGGVFLHSGELKVVKELIL